MKIKDKVAVVTGGAGTIGRAIALRIAEEGAQVGVADMDYSGASKVAAEIKAMNRKAIPIKVDVTKNEEAVQMATVALDAFGTIDILVNVAGGASHEKGAPFHESKEEIWDWIVDINLKGTRNCTRAVVETMIQKRSGKIISIASISGMIGGNPLARQVDYSSAKAGIIGFTKALAKELGPYNINVNCVSPGPILTPAFLNNSEEMRERAKQSIHLGRFGKPEDVAHMVAFLASEEANYVTGANFVVDGGRSLGP